MRQTLIALVVAVPLLSVGLSSEAMSQTTSRPAYGCFRVTAPEINIRARAVSSSDVVGQARRGDILVKRERFCALRGFWCPVTTAAGVGGWADKSLMQVAPCPARLSR
ncbi:MAG: SH3 domain-containing protein [Hyphomicrobiaceae bacterium]|nr:SH3 domain-containing protein [Hyphomicrobiaceae bacterium]